MFLGNSSRRFWWCVAAPCVVILLSSHDSMAFSGNTGGAFKRLLKDTKSEEHQRVGTTEGPDKPTDGKIQQGHVAVPLSGSFDMTSKREASRRSSDIDSLQAEIDSMYGKEEGLLQQIEMARLELEQEELKIRESIEESRRENLQARVEAEKTAATLEDVEKESLIKSQQEVARRKMLGDRLGYEQKTAIAKAEKKDALIRTKQELARRNMLAARLKSERTSQAHQATTAMLDSIEHENVMKSHIPEAGSQIISEAEVNRPDASGKSRALNWLTMGEKEAKIRAGRQRPFKETSTARTIESVSAGFEEDQIQTERRHESETKHVSSEAKRLDHDAASKKDYMFKKQQEMARRSMMEARFKFEKDTAELQAIEVAPMADQTNDRIEHVTNKDKTQHPYFAKVLANLDRAQALTDKLESVLEGEKKVVEEVVPPNQDMRIETTISAVEEMMKDQEDARKAEAKIRFEKDAAIANAVDEAWIEAEADRIRGEQEVCRRKMLQARLLSEKAASRKAEKARIKTQQEEARREMMITRFKLERETAKKIANEAIRIEREQHIARIRATQEASRRKMLHARLQYEKEATMKALEMERFAREKSAAEEKDARIEQELSRRRMLEARLQYQKDAAARSAEPRPKHVTPRRFREAYELWCDHYSKAFDESRLPVFQQNLLRVEAYYNFKGDPIKLNEHGNIEKINEHADRTMEEYKELTAAAKRKSEKERISKEIAAEEARLKAIEEAAEAARMKADEDERIAMQKASELKLLEEERIATEKAVEARLKILAEERISKEKATTEAKTAQIRLEREAARRKMLEARLQYEKEEATMKAREAATKQVMTLMQEESTRRRIVEERLQAEKEEAAANVKAKLAQIHAEKQEEGSNIQFETNEVTPDMVVIDTTITHQEEVEEKKMRTPRHAVSKLDLTLQGRSHHAPKQFVRGPTAHNQSRRSGYKPREWNIEWKETKEKQNTPAASSSASFEPNYPGQTPVSTRRQDKHKPQGWNIEWKPKDVSPPQETKVVLNKTKEAKSDFPTPVTSTGGGEEEEGKVAADLVAGKQQEKNVDQPAVATSTKPRIRLQSNEERRGTNSDRKFGWY